MTVFSAFSIVGLPGQGMSLGLDPLSLFFLVLLVPQGAAMAVAAARARPAFHLALLGMALAVLATDGFTLLFGAALMGAAAWALVAREDAKAAMPVFLIALFALACLTPALFLPPGAPAFVLVLAGGGAMAGLAPLHAWARRARMAASAPAAGLLAGGAGTVGLYILLRYGFVVLGHAAQPWWGDALILAGLATALPGALGSVRARGMEGVLAEATAAHTGLIAIALGIALRAKAMGAPSLAALALGAALLLAAGLALYAPLLFLGTGFVKRGTGTTALDWLGGLARGMPKLSGLMLAGAAGLAFLPFGPSFAALFLLLHAAILATAAAAPLAAVAFAALTALLGLAAALSLAASLRFFGTGFLGRPRTLRAAAAEEAPRRLLAIMGALALLSLPLALVPGFLLGALAPALGLLAAGATPPPPAYVPAPLILLALLPVGGAALLNRRHGTRAARDVEFWAAGLAKPPPWLPFGDPATQPSAAGFAEPVERLLRPWAGWEAARTRARGLARAAARRRPAVRYPAAGLLLLAGAAAALAAFGWGG